MIIQRILCVFALALVAPIAYAQQVPGSARAGVEPAALSESEISNVDAPATLYRLLAIYEKQGDLKHLSWTLQRLVVLQPNIGDLKFALAKAWALQDEKTRTYDLLLSMQKQGFGYDLSDDKNFEKVSKTKVWQYVVDNLKANLKPFGEGKVAFTLPGGDHLYDSLAFDPKRKQMLVGSVRDGTVQRVDKNGKLSAFIVPDADNGLWSVYAIAVAPDSDALYVASTASVYFKGFTQADFGKAGVFKFSLATGKLVDKYLLDPNPEPRTLSSIAVGKDGLVFAADGLRNVIYRVDGGALKPMVSNPRLTSLRGMAVSADGRNLYFADYVAGVFGVDLAAGRGFDLDYDAAKLTLGGIDGLYWYDGTLVAIENGMAPRRVIRLHLSADGHRIVRAMPLDAANPAFALPTYGTLAGDNLYFIANSQKGKYDKFGSPRDDAKLEPVKVFRSDLRFAWDSGGVEMTTAKPGVVSKSKPGTGRFSNVEAGAQSVSD